MNINLKQLEAFVWVADLGSFRRAAERLNTTQPNISTRISSLEAALNITLMERDAGSVRLTERGENLLAKARKVLRSTEEVIEASSDGSLYGGVLKLGVTEIIVHTWLRKYLRALKELFPNLGVELTVDISANLRQELGSRTIDLAFQNGPFERQLSGSFDLGVYPMIWVASPDLGLHLLNKPSLSDFTNNTILTHAKGTRPYHQIVEHFDAVSSGKPRFVSTSNLGTCLYMALDGLGVAALPSAMVNEELASGNLVVVNYNWVPEALSFLARFEAERTPSYVRSAAKLASDIATEYLLVTKIARNAVDPNRIKGVDPVTCKA